MDNKVVMEFSMLVISFMWSITDLILSYNGRLANRCCVKNHEPYLLILSKVHLTVNSFCCTFYFPHLHAPSHIQNVNLNITKFCFPLYL